jgi:hypothetical protein
MGDIGSPSPFSLNDSGTVAYGYFKSVFSGIYTSNGESVTRIADSNDFFGLFGPTPAINNSGTVAFRASLDDGNQGVFTSKGGSIRPLLIPVDF